MKCTEFAEIVHELARRGELDPAQAAIARAHAESCPACGCLLADARRLAAALREASAESRHLEAPERVESALMVSFRAANRATAQRSPRRTPGWLLAVCYGGALAAVSLLVFVSLARLPGWHPSPAVAESATASAGMTPSPAARGGSLAAQANTSLASGFVPVPFSGGIARGDAGVIVRVQVPRSALAELGYPVDETEGGGVVQADLLVGEDGWPHAVRIVR